VLFFTHETRDSVLSLIEPLSKATKEERKKYSESKGKEACGLDIRPAALRKLYTLQEPNSCICACYS
jgi:hypothetical protein